MGVVILEKNPKDRMMTFRFDQRTVEFLGYLKVQTGISASEIVRASVEENYFKFCRFQRLCKKCIDIKNDKE